MRDAASSEAMVEFYVEPFNEPTGTRTWVVREYRYEPAHYRRMIVSFHETREEAEAARKSRIGAKA